MAAGARAPCRGHPRRTSGSVRSVASPRPKATPTYTYTCPEQALAETQCGTTAYMSPERIRGESYAYASDIWSFAIVALEGACGAFPYPTVANFFEWVKRIVDVICPPISP